MSSQAQKTGDKHSRRTSAANRKKSQTTPSDSLVCTKCKKQFSDKNDKLIECERCCKWWCANCCNYTDTEYEVLSRRPEIHWFCDECQAPVITAVQTDKEIEERCNFYMDKLTSRLETIEKDLVKKADQSQLQTLEEQVRNIEKRVQADNRENKSDAIPELEAKVRQHLAEMERDKAASESRRANFIMYDIPEHDSEDGNERKREDTTKLTNILQRLKLGNKQPKVVNRLGRREQGKTRPLKIIMPNENDKVDVLKKIQSLKKSDNADEKQLVQDLRIAPDRTKKEREDYKKLRQELDERKSKGEENLIIRNNRIIKKDQRPFRERGPQIQTTAT